MLELKTLGHRYPNADAPALVDVSLAVPRGCVLGLLGPNGAGKTTLISHLSGALAVQSGEILIDGQPLQQVRAKAPTRIAVGLCFVLMVGVIALRVRHVSRQLEQRRQEATQLALTDSLTGLGNRLAFEAALAARFARHERFTLILADLDRFKSINDQFGHAAGDQVLKHVANALRGSGRVEAARLGENKGRHPHEFPHFARIAHHAEPGIAIGDLLDLGAKIVVLAAKHDRLVWHFEPL